MARRNFQVADINAMVPELEAAFVRIFQHRAALAALARKLERAGISVSPETIKDDRGPRAVRQAKAYFRAFHELLMDDLDDIEGMGGSVSDLEIGLVDFPSQRLGQNVFLCWRFGEREVGFWHDVDTGYASRRPLDAELSELSRPALHASGRVD